MVSLCCTVIMLTMLCLLHCFPSNFVIPETSNPPCCCFLSHVYSCRTMMAREWWILILLIAFIAISAFQINVQFLSGTAPHVFVWQWCHDKAAAVRKHEMWEWPHLFHVKKFWERFRWTYNGTSLYICDVNVWLVGKTWDMLSLSAVSTDQISHKTMRAREQICFYSSLCCNISTKWLQYQVLTSSVLLLWSLYGVTN